MKEKWGTQKSETIDVHLTLMPLTVEEKLERQTIPFCRLMEGFLKDYDFVLLQRHYLTCCDLLGEVIMNFFVGLSNYYDTFLVLLEH